MTSRKLLLAGLRHRWRSHVAVALVVAVATAILTGALVIGDSVRGSLRDLALDRLGHIDRLLVTPQPFRDQLAAETANLPGFDAHFTRAVPMLVLTGSVEVRGEGGMRRASDVQIVGYDDQFWKLAREQRETLPSGVVVTQAVAAEVGTAVGERLVLRLPTASALPADSALGEKSDTTQPEPLTVDEIVAGTGFARFDLFASQRPPRTVFVPLERLQELSERAGEANVLALATRDASVASDEEATTWIEQHFRPQLADYGLTLHEYGAGEATFWQLSSRGLVLQPSQIASVATHTTDVAWQPVSTYLANRIGVGERQIAYSLVSGVDSAAQRGPLLNDAGEPLTLRDDQIAINSWAAEQLEAEVGDTLTFTYYDPESTHGTLSERTSPELTIAAIVPLETADGQPTLAADPQLTPQLKGVTDEESIADWDLPFDLSEPITDADEKYWDDYRTTPKAFISLALARKLFASRWGDTSLLRTAPTGESLDSFASTLAQSLAPADLGLTLLPAKANALKAATGTTPFDGLFFGFSLFLIAAAIALMVIVFRLVLAARNREVGTLVAMGWASRTIQQLLGRELLLVAAVGSLIGVAAGIAYARLMILGLTTIWVDAIAAPFLTLHASARSLAIGGVMGLVVAAMVTWWALRGLVRQPAMALLLGRQLAEPSTSAHTAKRRSWLLPVCVIVALVSGMAGIWLRGEAQAGAFFGTGAATLAALLLLVYRRLTSRSLQRCTTGLASLTQLARANLYRQPLASTLLIGLVATASFLLVAISAFRLAPTDEGTGGFAWFATSDQPLHYELGTPYGRLKLQFNSAQETQLANSRVVAFRTSDGEAASCLHLFKPEQPRVLGVDPASMANSRFAWAAHAEEDPSDDPWFLLDRRLHDHHIPCVLDANTAMYSLQLYGGVGSTFTIRDGDNRGATMEVVGLLKNSVLQGDVLVSDKFFRTLFPTVSGHRVFLIDSGSASDVEELLESRLSDVGFDVTSSRDRLAAFLAVQNTYLSTFQALGGLGLLLGTIGLAAVTLRSVLQRRGELALMKACGYQRGRLVGLVVLENLVLVVGGLLLGIVAAAIALVPPVLVQDTALPLTSTLLLLLAVISMGSLTAWLATRQVLNRPLVAALRGD